jgi:hypothetical protein
LQSGRRALEIDSLHELNFFLPMIPSLHVSGFKIFRDLTLPRLGRLNLFVGENNTGKSCLLEAIGMYAGREPLMDIVETAGRRSADVLRPWAGYGTNEESSTLQHPVFDLFHSRQPSSIVIGRIGDSSPLRVTYLWHHRITDEKGTTRYVPTSPGDMVMDRIEMAVAVYKGDEQVGLLTRGLLPMPKQLSPLAYLPAAGFSEWQAAAMWDALVQGPGQEMVLDWMRILDTKIESLAYIEDRQEYRSRRLAILKLEKEGRIPLRSMGDGLTRLFHMGLAMASS